MRVITRVLQAAALFAVLAALCIGVLRGCSSEVFRFAFAPTRAFEPRPPLPRDAYDARTLWLARPGMAEDPAQWLPQGMPRTAPGEAAVFFVHSTSYLGRHHWNDPLDDGDADQRAQILVSATASAFNATGSVWVPRYRQAALGSFLAEPVNRQRAIDIAYGDVSTAFDAFLAAIPADVPIIIAGHSQGALHAARLLHDRVRGQPLARRVIAAYLIGWPVAARQARAQLGLPPCARPGEARCVVGWMTFAEPADAALMLETFHSFTAAGAPDAAGPMLCVNPLTGRSDQVPAPQGANLGTVLPDGDDPLFERPGPIRAGLVPAHCSPQGLLLIGRHPPAKLFVLPGNSYHIYDIPLFWANLRADVARRTAAWYGRAD